MKKLSFILLLSALVACACEEEDGTGTSCDPETGVCVPNGECQIGYHLETYVDNENIERTICVEDTHEACGSMGHACQFDEICTQGKCKDICQPGEVICAGACINPMKSQKFCGADTSCTSYIPCSEFEECYDGKCKLTACQNPEDTLCIDKDQNICVNVHGNDPNHCGACDTVCLDKETAKTNGCENGQCTYTCHDGMTNCGSNTAPICLSNELFLSDPLHCGDCETKCADNELCQNGQCIVSSCPENTCLFNNACINQNDHCGTQCLNCNTANNASAGICQAGSCVITACTTGYHLNSEGVCEADSATACPNGKMTGTVDCNTLDAYTKSGICVDAKCQATACQPNAHLKDGKCVADSPQECGTLLINCTTNAGWKSGKCENGQCIAATCQQGYCLNQLSGQCTNAQSISTCGIDGGTCQSCNPKQVCSEGACVAKQCEGNVCNQTTDADETLVCINDNAHCGSNCQNCNTFTQNAVSGECNMANGTCTVTQCNHGFHIYNNSCEKDDTNNCGDHHKACADIVPGWKQGECNNQQCKATECHSGNHLTNQGMCEPDTDTCCGTTCQHCNAGSTCINGSCQTGCLAFHDTAIGQYALDHWDTNHDGCISRSEAEAVTEIPEKAFYNNTSLNSLSDLEQFPNLRTVGESAFSGCESLTSVSLPQVTHIGNYAFAGCMNIASIDLPQVTYIGNRAFGGVSEHDYDKGLVGGGCYGHITGCFYEYGYGIIRESIQNTSLTSVNLPQVTYIGDEAFSGCTSLASVDLPQATYIGERAFVGGVYENDYHVKVHDLDYDGGNDEYYSSEYIDPDQSHVTRWITENTGLTSVNLPKATHIGDYAFSGCTGLTSVDLPQATHIGDYAFAGGVSALVWYDGREIDMSISENTSLTSIDLPKATYIGDYAFSGCTGLTSVNLPQATHIGDGAFVGGKFEFDIYSGHYDYYFSDLCDGENTSLASVSLPKATYIGSAAFAHCTGLTSIDLPQATHIGDYAFNGCTGLTSIDLPQATEIGKLAFEDCTGLTAVDLPQATEIGWDAFSGCKGLTSIDLPQATEIGSWAFSGCTGLTSIDLPQATYIGNNAFSGCKGLTSIELPQATYISNKAFSGCKGLTSIELPQATYIEDYAFSNCTSLSSLALTSPNEITLTEASLEPMTLYGDPHILTLDKVTLTLHQNKAVGGSSSPLCTSATEWGDKTWKEIRFVQ